MSEEGFCFYDKLAERGLESPLFVVSSLVTLLDALVRSLAP